MRAVRGPKRSRRRQARQAGHRADRGARRRSRAAGARRPVRSLRHRRRDQRVGAEGDRPRRRSRSRTASALLEARRVPAAAASRTRGRAQARQRHAEASAKSGGRGRSRPAAARSRRRAREGAPQRRHDPHRRRRARRMRGRLAGRVSAACRSRCTKCGRSARPRSTRPIASPSWSAATPSAATSSITPSVCSRRRCGGLARSSCAPPRRAACPPARRWPSTASGSRRPSPTRSAVHPLITIVRDEVTAIPPLREADAGHRRDRTAHLRRPVGGHRAAGRRRAPVLLRRDQPDRARRIDRSHEGLPTVAMGPQPAPCEQRAHPVRAIAGSHRVRRRRWPRATI